MKPLRFTRHAQQRLVERGASEEEVRFAQEKGRREEVRQGRVRYRLNFEYKQSWQSKYYDVKQVCPVMAETPDEMVVITVYTFYF